MKKTHKLKVYKAILGTVEGMDKVPPVVRVALKKKVKNIFVELLTKTDDYIEAIEMLKSAVPDENKAKMIQEMMERIKPRLIKFLKAKAEKDGVKVTERELMGEILNILKGLRERVMQMLKDNPDADLSKAKINIAGLSPDGIFTENDEEVQPFYIKIPQI